MNLKNKLILIVLSLLSFALTALYMHDVIWEENLKGDSYFTYELSFSEPIVIASVDLSNLHSGGYIKRGHTRKAHTRNPYFNTTWTANKSLRGVDRKESVLSTQTEGIAKRMHRETRNNSSSSYQHLSAGIVPVTSRPKQSFIDRSTVYASASLSSISGGNMLTPFAAPQNPGGYVLVDPMPDEDMQMIPVGEGWWLLLLLGVGYIGIKRHIGSAEMC